MAKGTIKFEQLMADLKNKIYHPVYFMTGEEPYYIDIATSYIIENILTDDEKAFNQTVFYGKDSDTAAIIDAARRFPMMANHQVIVVKEAQELRNFDNFVHYIQAPLRSTILVINYKYKSLDKRKKLYKTIEENSIIFESAKLYDDKIPGWITRHLEEKNIRIEPKAATMLTDFLGNDLSKINNELQKLIITLEEGSKTITALHVEKYIGISREYNNYELQHALARKDALHANRIINYFAENQKNNPMVVTLSSLYYFFSKLLLFHSLKDRSEYNAAAALKIKPFFVREYETAARNFSSGKVVRIISLLREYDLKLKGFGSASVPPGELLKELIFKILH